MGHSCPLLKIILGEKISLLPARQVKDTKRQDIYINITSS